jgi:hypothetical protein
MHASEAYVSVSSAKGALLGEFSTFEGNGVGSSAQGRSEINLDDQGAGTGASIRKNIFAIGNTLINNCYDVTSLMFGISDNVVFGATPSGAKGNCISGSQNLDPQFANLAVADYRPGNAATKPYGAYAP